MILSKNGEIVRIFLIAEIKSTGYWPSSDQISDSTDDKKCLNIGEEYDKNCDQNLKPLSYKILLKKWIIPNFKRLELFF